MSPFHTWSRDEGGRTAAYEGLEDEGGLMFAKEPRVYWRVTAAHG